MEQEISNQCCTCVCGCVFASSYIFNETNKKANEKACRNMRWQQNQASNQNVRWNGNVAKFLDIIDKRHCFLLSRCVCVCVFTLNPQIYR